MSLIDSEFTPCGRSGGRFDRKIEKSHLSLVGCPEKRLAQKIEKTLPGRGIVINSNSLPQIADLEADRLMRKKSSAPAARHITTKHSTPQLECPITLLNLPTTQMYHHPQKDPSRVKLEESRVV